MLIRKNTFQVFIAALLLTAGTSFIYAQSLKPSKSFGRQSSKVEITPFFGYQFTGAHDIYAGEIDISDNANFGLSVNYDIPYKRGMQFEFFWLMQNSVLNKKDYATGVTEPLFDLTTHYFHAGGIYGMRKGNMLPFISAGLGTTLFHPDSRLYTDEWFFSFSLGLGLKYYINDRFGIRLQGRMLLPVLWNGGGLWCGTGGCSIGMGANSAIFQGDLSAGLIVRF
jgi:opacity protein-like surface antigen